MRRIALLLALLFAAAVFLSTLTVSADEPVVRMILFWSKTCPACHKVLEDILPPIQEKYGDQLEVKRLDVSEPDNYKLFLALEEAYQVPKELQGVPVIFIGQTFLAGWVDIGDHLDEEIQRYLAAGGVDYPVPASEVERLPEEGCRWCPTPSAAESSAPTKRGKPIHLAYFHQPGCAECDRARYDLKFLQSQYPQLVVEFFSIPEDAALSEWLGQRYGVPKEKRLTAPAVFVGEDYLLGDEVNSRNLQALVEKYAAKGADRVWEDWEREKAEAKAGIVARFRSLSALTILAAGLINGLNPCAFVTIIFFISYLAFMGRKGREVLLVGAAFTLGVFITYLLIGLGLSKALEPLADLQATLKRWVLGIAIALCLALAAISLYDYFKARAGKVKEMKIKLSPGLQRQIHRLIRESSSVQTFTLAAFAIGFAVSIIQLTCTSPLYIGVTFLIHDVPELRTNAFLYLLLYNLAYIVPLVAIFILAYLGTSSHQFARFVDRHTATIKLATALLFLVLAGWLIYVWA